MLHNWRCTQNFKATISLVWGKQNSNFCTEKLLCDEIMPLGLLCKSSTQMWEMSFWKCTTGNFLFLLVQLTIKLQQFRQTVFSLWSVWWITWERWSRTDNQFIFVIFKSTVIIHINLKAIEFVSANYQLKNRAQHILRLTRNAFFLQFWFLFLCEKIVLYF